MTWVANASPELDAQSQWRTVVAVCVILSFVAGVIVGMRLWIRARTRGMAADDWMASLSLLFAVLYSIICIIRECGQSIPTFWRWGAPVAREER